MKNGSTRAARIRIVDNIKSVNQIVYYSTLIRDEQFAYCFLLVVYTRT